MPRKRRNPLKITLACFIVLLLVAGALAGILVLLPDLALLVPGAIGDKAHAFASAAREHIEIFISDQGPLGGLRRAVEPFLSRVGLNLQTVLLALVLLVFAIICIRILAITSRPDADDEGAGGPVRGRSRSGGSDAYWPYDHRPGSRRGMPPVEIPNPPAAAPLEPDPYAVPVAEVEASMGSPGDSEAFDFPAAATGDAWPMVRKSFPRVSKPPVAPPVEEPMDEPVRQVGPALSQSYEPPAEVFEPQAPPAPVEPADQGYLEPRRPSAHSGRGSAPGQAADDFMPSIVPSFDSPEPVPLRPSPSPSMPIAQPPQAATPAQPPQPFQPMPSYPAVEPQFEGSGAPARPVEDEYMADMPTPVYGRAQAQAPEVAFPPAAADRAFPPAAAWPPVGGRPLAEAPLGGPVARRPQAGEAVVESRPALGTGLSKFILPGLILLLLGAAAAYGLQTPLAVYVTGGPYGSYLLISAAAVLCMGVAMWFMAGPMKATSRRLAGAQAGRGFGEMAAAAEHGVVTGRFGGDPGRLPKPRALGGAARATGRAIAPAPIPGRAALESGLDAPDAIDWSRLSRPSIFLPGTQTHTTVGLDIGTAWIKVAQVGVGRNGLELVNLGLVPTPEGVLAEGDINDPEALGDVLKDLLASRNIIQRQVTAALGGQGVIIRHVQFPAMTPEELREVLRWEAEHHIPIPPSEAVVDFTVIPGQGDADERGNRQMRVMLVGAQKRVVEAQVEALRRAKLTPRGVDAEALASYRVIEAAGHFEDDPLRYAQAVIDLGHSSTKLGVYLRGALEMSRTLGVGGRTFTAVLAERLKVPEVEAETLKRQYGVHPEGGRVLQALTPTLQDLMFEVRRSFEFFASRHFGQSVRHVYLVGGGARMPGMASTLVRYLNPSLGERVPEGAEVRVEVIDPLTAVSLTPRLDRQANLIGPEFVTALGLALSDEEVATA